MDIRRYGFAALLVAAAAVALGGTGFLVPDGEGEPAPAPEAGRAAPSGTPALPPAASPSPGRTAPPCPEPGVSVSAGEVSAAMGLRAVSVELTNCGEDPYRVDGHPVIGVLDEDGDPLGLTVRRLPAEPSGVERSTPADLAPGDSITAVLSWRNTVTYGETAEGAFVSVAPAPGRPAQRVPLHVDAGTTGEIEVTAWGARLPG